MRIVVTGGAGFVGSHLCDAFLARGDSVVCLDNFSTGRPDNVAHLAGNPEVHPQIEDYWGHVNPIGPRSVYDEAKRFAEALTCAYGRARGLDVGVIRIFNTYGPRMSPRDGRVVTNFITQALSGEPVTIYGDGTQTRSFCYVDDLIRGMVAMIDSAERGPVNLGNPEELSVTDLADLVLRITGSSSLVEYRPLPTDDPARRCPDVGRAREVLGWHPETPVAEGIRRTAAWLMPYCAPTSGWRADTVLPA